MKDKKKPASDREFAAALTSGMGLGYYIRG